MLRYRVNALELCKKAGYTTYYLQKNKIVAQSAIQDMRHGKLIGIKSIAALCQLLKCQPGDLIEWVDDEEIKS